MRKLKIVFVPTRTESLHTGVYKGIILAFIIELNKFTIYSYLEIGANVHSARMRKHSRNCICIFKHKYCLGIFLSSPSSSLVKWLLFIAFLEYDIKCYTFRSQEWMVYKTSPAVLL